MPRKPRISVDAVLTFQHQGKSVIVTLQHAQWLGEDRMRYTWKAEDGKTFQTDGVPKDVKVLADPGRKGLRQAMEKRAKVQQAMAQHLAFRVLAKMSSVGLGSRYNSFVSALNEARWYLSRGDIEQAYAAYESADLRDLPPSERADGRDELRSVERLIAKAEAKRRG